MASQQSPGADADPDQPVEQYPLPPGPDGYPLVGSTLQFARDPFGYYETLAEYGDIVRYNVAGRTFTTLLAPEYIERVLVEEPERFERFLFGDQGLDFAPEGLLFTDGEQWATQRERMQPAFTMDRIQSYGETMATYTTESAAAFEDGQEIALNREFSDLTLRILAKALFDIDVSGADEGAAITRMARVINERGDAGNLSTFLPTWVPTPGNWRYKRAIEDARDRIAELIDRHRSGNRDGDDLLSLLLTAGEGEEGLSETEIRDNLITFMFAGHETSSLVLSYTFLLLAQHEDVLDRLRTELDSVVGDERPGFRHVPQLTYTEQVLREAMRRYPPAYVLFREVTAESVIGGYRIPEGTILSLPQFRLHTDERYWDAPDAFRPERWAGEDDRPEYAYFPFGGGPRHCIGMRFAMLEMKLVVAILARAFDMTLLSDPDPELSAGATMQPQEDVRVRLHRR